MSEKFLLKVFSGLQLGAEVALDEGDYAIGSGPDDDIQLKDASLNSQHAFLKVEAEKIKIRANSGAILFGNGLTLEAGDDRWVDIDPLSPLVLGSTRLAFGLEGAHWNTITEDASFRSEVQPNYGKPLPNTDESDGPKSFFELAGIQREHIEAVRRFLDPLIERAMNDRRFLYGGAGGFAAFIVLILLLQAIFGGSGGLAIRDPVKDKQRIEAALAEYPFASHIRVVQDTDGQISIRGIIKDIAERRTLLNAVQATGVPIKSRISSAENIAADIDNLILSQGLNVKATLKDDGSLMLSGQINDPAVATKFIQLVKDQVVGPTSFDFTRLKDGNALLIEVVRFAKDEGVSPTVTFSLGKDGAFIEANGTVLFEQSDAWSNFLKNYTVSFGPRMKLRSFVEVAKQSRDATLASDTAAPAQNATVDGRILDVATLKSATSQANAAKASEATSKPAPSVSQEMTALSQDVKDAGASVVPVEIVKSVTLAAPVTQAPPVAAEAVAVEPVNVQPAFASVALPSPQQDVLLEQEKPASTVDAREPLGAENFGDLSILNECTGARIQNFDDLANTIATIDQLSAMNGQTLTSFDKRQQLTLAEIILNPTILKRCLSDSAHPELIELKNKSSFFREIESNPEFIRFIFRDIKPTSLVLTGADLTGDYSILDKSGRRLKKGSWIDIYSRVFNIAELGVIVETAAGMELSIFDSRISWVIRPREP